MTNNTPKNPRGWQKRIEVTQQLEKLMAEYSMRKSKLIKYVPTEKELREAMRFYRFLLELSEEGDPNATKMKEILNSVSEIPEEHIKFVGFMEESLKNYPSGDIPYEFMMNIAEKWDVLEYVVEDIIIALGIKLKK